MTEETQNEAAGNVGDNGTADQGDPVDDTPGVPPGTQLGVETRWQVAWTDGKDRDLKKLPGNIRSALLAKGMDQLLDGLDVAPDVLVLHALKRSILTWAPEIFMEAMRQMPGGAPPGHPGVRQPTPEEAKQMMREHQRLLDQQGG